MMPGAGLFLPHSSHVNPNATSNSTEALTSTHKYFERKTPRQNSLDTSRTPSRTSLALSRKSSEDVTRVFSSLSTVFDFADYASSHGKVSSDNEVFVNLLQRVRHDVTEASRLYNSQAVTDYFESWPDRKTWIDTILLDIQRALNDIGVYMETLRVAGDDGGSTGLRRKYEWVLSHQKKLVTKHQNLTVCHSSLMAAVNVMLTAEMNVAFSGQDPIYEAPTRPWIPEDARDVLRGPHSRQKLRLGQKNSSVPSILVSEADGDTSDVKSIDHAPVELPGSTPDDLPHPDNLDLYASPPNLRSASMDMIREETHSLVHREAKSVENIVATTIPARRSLDQMRSLELATLGRSRGRLRPARPRAYSDQNPPKISLEDRSQRSSEDFRILPTLTEKPLERYDSNASVTVTQAATVPLTTMRYKPQAVNVRKPPVKQHVSLPIRLSRLPSLSGHTSLLDDLSNWVIPPTARPGYSDSPKSLTPSTSPTSSVSSPVVSHVPTACPGIVQGFDHDAAPPVAASPPTVGSTTTSSPKSQPYMAYKPHIPSNEPSKVSHIVGHDSSTVPAPKSPITTQQQGTVSAQNTHPVSHNSPTTAYSMPPTRDSIGKIAEQITELSTSGTAVEQRNESTSTTTSSTEVKPREHKATKSSDSTLEATPSQPNRPAALPTPTPAGKSQPMTAQAKRRAAHERRMQLAFGGGKNNSGREGIL